LVETWIDDGVTDQTACLNALEVKESIKYLKMGIVDLVKKLSSKPIREDLAGSGIRTGTGSGSGSTSTTTSSSTWTRSDMTANTGTDPEDFDWDEVDTDSPPNQGTTTGTSGALSANRTSKNGTQVNNNTGQETGMASPTSTNTTITKGDAGPRASALAGRDVNGRQPSEDQSPHKASERLTAIARRKSPERTQTQRSRRRVARNADTRAGTPPRQFTDDDFDPALASTGLKPNDFILIYQDLSELASCTVWI